ncbi:hydantoinase/oxoprolinase family protein [Bradyrhizobium sp. AUGA SZCCT0177]|uniref:hydantoinase/oxoprolinase family protein n=1 Tax=Bradyrhizobium sp. AUGA SZCCT0177 TaxID=2807665 RepID=UPI001BAA71A6|nr:hydantoinase/oxoprolinase family protein [Bradyrhizobium sp. AUGA SZCCT0177]MBR1282085.1 hydantoinase/oxoprolinase family protein [Bradyrhizobium sp. AUGA SZCCT0177]
MSGLYREWEVGTDIGGTFTDIIAIRRDPAETRIAKVPSRPHAPVDAMLEALEAIGLQKDQVKRFVHGTTRVTNAIVEERLPKVALIATAGFEDVLDIARYRRRDLYRLDIPPKSPSLVPRELCFGLVERLDHEGNVLKPLQDLEIDRLVTWLKQTGVQSVAVALLHAYANPVHERILAERLKAIVPHVSLSHEVNPEAREYERTSSTVFNAAAMPIAVEYLSELEQRLPIGPGLQVFHSAGAMVPIAAVKRRPLVMAMSGPAAGVSASVSIARQLGTPRMLTFDMGGTTTDVCLIIDGQAEMADGRMLGDRPLRQPMLAVHSIGAGGGSIVRNGPGGLTVGPQSAGSEPGPACYGRGGTAATITDANAVLGYLNPETRLGDRISLDIEAARRAIAPIAQALKLGLEETALGIVKVANATMARALRRVTVERGIDGRDCTLLAFGGGGPMHAAGMADLYGIGSIVVPNASSAFSALGCLTADFSFLQQQTFRVALDGIDLARVLERIETLIGQASEPLIANGVARAEIDVELVALMRYAAQNDAIAVPFSLPLNTTRLREDFLVRHHELFGYATQESCVIESVRVQARRPSTTIVDRPTTAVRKLQVASRRCTFDGGHDVATVIVDRASMKEPVLGPAIIEDAWSTIVVPPGWQAKPDTVGHLFLTKVRP